MTLCWLILTHGESEVFSLVEFLRKHLLSSDRILILNDPTTPEYFAKLQELDGCKVVEHKLDGDYSEHRNYALQFVHADFLFALDADERPAGELIQNIRKLIDCEPDLVWIPRVNIVEGAMPIHAMQFGWTVTDGMWNWPDPQSRILRMGKGIKWVGKLHERLKPSLQGCKIMRLPENPKCAIIHRKTIARQISQNEIYNQKFSPEENSGLSTMEELK